MHKAWKIVGELTAVALVLAFVGMMAFIPHLNTSDEPVDPDRQPLAALVDATYDWARDERGGYPFTVHVDENMHWVRMAGIQRYDQVFIDYPNGDASSQEGFFSLRGAVHERGYHVLLAEAQELTGVSWFRLHQFLPALWAGFTAFGVYALLRPHASALPAAAFVGLIPTTARFIGPSFLVPIGFSLAWLPAVLIALPAARKRAATAALLLVLVTWTLFVHLTAGLAAIGLVGLAALFGGAKDRRSALVMALVALAPLTWLYRTFTDAFLVEALREERLPVDYTIFDSWGFLAMGLWVVGLLLLVLRPPEDARVRAGMTGLAALSILALGSILSSLVFEFQQGRYATYARWHPIFFLAASGPMGHAVGVAYEALAAGTKRLAHRRGAGAGVGLGLGRAGAGTLAAALVVVAASPAVGVQLDEPYYQVIDGRDWQAYNWIAANVDPDDRVFLTHPWKAPILAAMTDMDPYTWLHPGNPPINDEPYLEYLRSGGKAEFYVLNDVTLVIGDEAPPAQLFDEVHPRVWMMKDEYARELARLRAR